MKEYLEYLNELHKIYQEVLDGKKVEEDRIKDLTYKISNVNEQDELMLEIANIFRLEKNLINKMRSHNVNKENTIEDIRNDFQKLEVLHFNIINAYIRGKVLKADYDAFCSYILGFKDKLYSFTPEESEILEIAKMKSKVQHYITEVVEDEDLIKTTYENI